MILLGTIFNTITVAAGSTLGLFSGRLISSKAQTNIITIFGLFTIAMSIDMMRHMNEPILVFLALVIGTLIGGGLKLHKKFTVFASRFDKGDSPDTQSLSSGFIKATMLFCVGGMTIIGCLNEGIDGDYNLIMVKSFMDLISSFFLASALGKGVLLSALGVFTIQGGLTIAFHYIGMHMTQELILDLTATGGILLLALGLDLVGVKKFQMLDLIPALVLLPLINYIHLLVL
jgi:uncharacterized membrane protein YqgA involved in biofilm formation